LKELKQFRLEAAQGDHAFEMNTKYLRSQVRSGKRLSLEHPNDEADQQTQEQTGDDWKIKTDVAPLEMNVSWQSAEPIFANAGPEQRSNNNGDSANDHQHLTHFAHRAS